MTTPNPNPNDANTVVDPNAVPEGSVQHPAEGAVPPKEEGVNLTAEQYNAMLDALDEFDDLKTTLAKKSANPTVDSLAEEGNAPGGTAPPTGEGVDQLEGAALVDHIINQVNTQIGQPLLVKIEEMRLDAEIKDLTKDGKNADFWDYKDAIFQVASRNPNLSIKEAYNLAKSNKGTDVTANSGDNTNLLKNLPNRRTVPIGEKPGLPAATVKSKDPATRQEAATTAWDEMEKEGKV